MKAGDGHLFSIIVSETISGRIVHVDLNAIFNEVTQCKRKIKGEVKFYLFIIHLVLKVVRRQQWVLH